MMVKIENFLAEDIGGEDTTTDSIVPILHQSKARIIAKDKGMLAGQRFAREVFALLDKKVVYEEIKSDGEDVSPGDIVATISGRTRAILTGERVALNILQRLSGIATLTAGYVKAVEGTGVKILDTRKTTPGLRDIERYAVRVGGGSNHRNTLSDMVLIKENHISVAGSITDAVARVRKKTDISIEVEVKSMEELKEALSLSLDRIMLDNWKTEEMAQAVMIVQGMVPLEASGGITLENVRKVAATGVDYISVGALTHSAKALDLSLLFEGIQNGAENE